MVSRPQSDLSNPTQAISLDFGTYLTQRQQELSAHLASGVPDYSFSLDRTLQKQIASIGPIRALTQTIVSFAVPIQKQIQQMQSIAVSPRQYPEIYAIGEECAHRLGIGIPQIFICSALEGHACTIATDDVTPMIILSSGIVERLELEELKFVIGHECGHIHNLHGVYNTAVELMTNALIRMVLDQFVATGLPNLLDAAEKVIHGGIMLFLLRWSRCAEITCDRAGLICCGDLNTANVALAKLITGGGDRLKNINIQEFINQVRTVQSTPVRLLELASTHPLLPRRMEALNLFTECDTFYVWRQELQSPKTLQNQVETDRLCEQIVSIMNNKVKTN
ncbi:MAG: M48 family metallopeptidase [Leptolyngbyaceae cyanobacterium SL_5_14]|nr:M48 family metallopeptidase [Leptolyngbyaceae cyanobacterium SL_5_14]